jgi:hypothetical protein
MGMCMGVNPYPSVDMGPDGVIFCREYEYGIVILGGIYLLLSLEATMGRPVLIPSS